MTTVPPNWHSESDDALGGDLEASYSSWRSFLFNNIGFSASYLDAPETSNNINTDTTNDHTKHLEPNKQRFLYVLAAPTSMATKLNEDSMTYLNQAQAYEIKLENQTDISQGKKGFMCSIINIGFHERNFQLEESELWQQWTQQHPDESIFSVDMKLSYNVFGVGSDGLNKCEFLWDSSKVAGLFLRINSISTFFSPKKHGGASGIPFRLSIETFSYNSKTHESRHFISASSCRIKVFKPKGAERKIRSDRERVMKKPIAEQAKYSKSLDVTLFRECSLNTLHPNENLNPLDYRHSHGQFASKQCVTTSSPSEHQQHQQAHQLQHQHQPQVDSITAQRQLQISVSSHYNPSNASHPYNVSLSLPLPQTVPSSMFASAGVVNSVSGGTGQQASSIHPTTPILTSNTTSVGKSEGKQASTKQSCQEELHQQINVSHRSFKINHHNNSNNSNNHNSTPSNHNNSTENCRATMQHINTYQQQHEHHSFSLNQSQHNQSNHLAAGQSSVEESPLYSASPSLSHKSSFISNASGSNANNSTTSTERSSNNDSVHARSDSFSCSSKVRPQHAPLSAATATKQISHQYSDQQTSPVGSGGGATAATPSTNSFEQISDNNNVPATITNYGGGSYGDSFFAHAQSHHHPNHNHHQNNYAHHYAGNTHQQRPDLFHTKFYQSSDSQTSSFFNSPFVNVENGNSKHAIRAFNNSKRQLPQTNLAFLPNSSPSEQLPYSNYLANPSTSLPFSSSSTNAQNLSLQQHLIAVDSCNYLHHQSSNHSGNFTSQTAQQPILPANSTNSNSAFTLNQKSNCFGVFAWLKANRFGLLSKTFNNFSGSDLLRLTKSELIQIAGVVDGIRLYNCLHS